MNRNKLMRRLSVVAAFAIVLAVAAGTPVLQAQPEAGAISTGTAQVWNGHNCPANVPVNISALSAGLGGYETKIAWPVGRFNNNTPADVGVAVSSYLAVNGRTNSAAGGTTLLKAVVGDTVKFGDYSWGANNPAGNTVVGQLATVALKPTATCGAAALTMSETQLVDINGAVIMSTGQTGSSVSVFGRYDVNGDLVPVALGTDVLAVVSRLGTSITPNCGSGYQFDVNLDNIPVVLGTDVLAVVSKLGQSSCQ